MSEERCSFCNRKKSEVKHLVAGKKAMICDGCAKICKNLLVEGMKDDKPVLHLPTDDGPKVA